VKTFVFVSRKAALFSKQLFYHFLANDITLVTSWLMLEPKKSTPIACMLFVFLL